MSDINKYTTKEVLNKVLLDSSGNAVNAYSHTSQEAFNAALDDANSRLNVNLVGGTIGGDVTITGDLTVNGGGSLAFDEIIQGTQVIDVTNTEALLVRKNDDGGDVFVVDTTNSGVGINTSAGGWGLNIKGSDANVFKVQASDGNTLSFLQGTNGDATQKWFADGNVTKVLINTNGDSYFTGGSLGIGTASPTMSLEISNTSFGDQLRLHRSSVASGGFLTLSANDSAGNIHDYAKLGTVVESSTNGSEDGALVFQTSLDGTLTEYLRVTSAGNVGIGTDSPRKIFHSYSSTGVNIVGLFESSDNQALIAFRDNTTGDDNHVMIGANGTSFAISTDNTERMVIDSSGNVTVNSGSAIQFGDSSYKIIGSTAGNYLRFYTESTQALEINDSQNATFAGNVTVNGDTLSLVKSNNNAFLKIESTDGGEAIFEMRATTNRTNQIRFFEGATQRGSIVYAHASQSLAFNTGDSGTLALTLDSSQNATFAGAIKQFRDDSSTVGTNDVVIENDGAGDASIKFSLTGATDWYAYVDNSDSDKFKIRRSTTDYLTIDESGDSTFNGNLTVTKANTTASFIGLFTNDGNASNRYGLKVTAGADDGSGTTYYLHANDGNGDNIGHIANISNTFQLTDASDVSLKDNIRDTDVNGLEVVESIKVRDFEWKKSNDTMKAGFVAQELKESFEPAVSEMESGLLGVSRDRLVPVLIKAVQELSARVKELENN